jgi:centromere protein C
VQTSLSQARTLFNDIIISESHLRFQDKADKYTGTGLTPTQVLSTRKSLRGASIPRSSPARKTGINGDARRSQGADLFSPEKEMPQFDPEDRENSPALSPIPQTLHQAPRRFEPSPEKSPLRDITTVGASSAKGKGRAIEPAIHFDHEFAQETADPELDEYEPDVQSIERASDGVDPRVWDDVGIHGDDDEDPDFGNQATLTEELPLRQSIEEEPELFEQVFKPQPTQANSRRKRKSGVIEEEVNPVSSPTPEAKRHKATSKKPTVALRPKSTSVARKASSEAPEKAPAKKDRPPKSNNEAQLSTRQQSELDGIIEKVRARPGQQKSLYILRRETPADDSITHTRSGRVSVKPLAYWRNERCVYGGSPGGAQLADGARFPLNSIKEIVRTEEVDHGIKKRRGIKKGKGKGRKHLEDSDSDSDLDEPSIDPHAEEWEIERGIFRGPTSVWDPVQQAPLEVEEEVDLAYAPAAIETREVKGSDFKYAKLLSTPFFGTGIVDLPPGAEKRPKNSRKMLMSFFVFTGRVTVEVGPYGKEQSRFSVGKGGFWTVPRGEFTMCY